MTVQILARERRALVATLAAADPDAGTLCEGWTVRHLLAHLVLREHRPWELVADRIAGRPPGQEPRLAARAAQARRREDYQRLVQQFAGGPPGLFPERLLGPAVNLLEYVIHHEDVRRGGPAPQPPRELPLDLEQAVWRQLRRTAGLWVRSSGRGVVLAPPGRTAYRPRSGSGTVVLEGEPVELALYLAGRKDAARVVRRVHEG